MNEETMGKRISAHRKRLNLTQDALAERLGVTAQAVSKWENDQSCPDIAMLPKLAQVFGTSVDALLGVEQAVPAEPVPEVECQSPGTSGEEGWKVEWQAGSDGGVALAIWVLLTGGLLLFSNIQGKGADLWELLWPSGLLVFGGYGLLRRFSAVRLGCALVGAWYILSALDMIPFPARRDLLLPAYLLLFGVSLLTDALRRPRRRGFRFIPGEKHRKNLEGSLKTEGERFWCNTAFGENRHAIRLARLSAGDAEVSFGELVVDLTGCGQIADGCMLTGSCAFGELEFRVPANCRVEPSVSTAFGALNVAGEPSPDADTVLYLDGSVSFGEIKIKYF